MGAGIFGKLLGSLEAAGEKIPDQRRNGCNLKYRLLDGIKSAFAVFFFQHPSLLDFQRAMKERKKRNNVETLFGVTEIPSDNQIRTLLDGIEPGTLGEVFGQTLRTADEAGVIQPYRVLDGGVLLALDGLWYYSSQEVHCEHCLHQTHGDEKTYYHSAVAGAIVRPGNNSVLPVMAEPITNRDGKEKQDCEHEAGKRWLLAHGREYQWLKPTLLGDDLYSDQPFCLLVLEQKMSFLFTCKPDSHPWLSETVEHSFPEERVVRKWTGRYHQISTYRWINGVPLRDSGDALMVNYLYVQIRNEETGKVGYTNSWVTDKKITGDTVELLASCGRARWKIENEHNNVLKNRGYNLEHNFGHGKRHAAEIFLLLNLLAFQFHTILEMCDGDYQKARASVGRRDSYFHHMQAALRYALHASWRDFLIFVRGDDGDSDDGG
jgi:hypothetical protein